jgi:enoyl-CoA hydratase/carnithine racemase
MDGITLARYPVNGSTDAAIAEIILDRPPANALSTSMAFALAKACAELSAEATTRAILISANPDGRGFCAGADLKERAAMTDAQFVAQRPVVRAMFDAIRALPQPAIAAVHGFALGGWCEIALCCDLVVADESAFFGLPEVTVGLVPGGGGTQLALRKLGGSRAADMVLTGRKVPVGEAAELGIVNRRVAAGRARAEALALAGLIAANSPVAVRAAKQALRAGWGTGLEAALAIEDAAWRTAAASPDRREGIAAFAAKRPPNWEAP